MPHAFVIMTADKVGVLVHLGIDTVALEGEGFTTHVSQGDEVTAGQRIVTYDVPAIVAKGLNPVVPVVVMDERNADNIKPDEAVLEGAVIAPGPTCSPRTRDRTLMEVVVLQDRTEIGRVAADAVAALLDRKPDAVLGLATGSSPLPIYDELAARHAAGALSFKQARGSPR